MDLTRILPIITVIVTVLFVLSLILLIFVGGSRGKITAAILVAFVVGVGIGIYYSVLV